MTMQSALRVAFVALPLLIAAVPHWAHAVDGAPRAVTARGEVAGIQVDDIAVFRGVPFAAPPIGALRWREPQPAARWAGMRQATVPGNACPQKRGLSLEGGGDPGELSEDCLYLNIWAPLAEPGQRRPVMVWLHGGALIFGAGSLPLYDGSALARQGVIVVTVNYRLGPLGYFAHPALERAAPGGAANFGLLDQIAALQWVQKNIAAFGGDAQQVTVFGQSAGAQSVLALMASPKARGLFQRAIAQSPYGLPSHTRAQARASGIRVADAVGLPGANATVAQLRAVSAEQLAALEGQNLSLAPSLIVGDAAAVPRTILAAFQAKQQMAVPLIVGSNSNETSVALAFGLDPAALVKKLGKARILVGPLYPGIADEAELGRQVIRDIAFSAFARRIAVLHAPRAPTWRYYFDQLPIGDRGREPGVAHGGEVTAVFGTGDLCKCLNVPLTDADRKLWQGISSRWAAFATTGKPDAASGPIWPTDSLWRPVVMAFGETTEVKPGFMAQRLNTLILGLKLVGRTGDAE
jgi:para-nitrobenzyl esterase